MIYRIISDWEELDEKWIGAWSKEEAREYLEDMNCEWTFGLEEVEGVPMDEVDYETREEDEL